MIRKISYFLIAMRPVSEVLAVIFTWTIVMMAPKVAVCRTAIGYLEADAETITVESFYVLQITSVR